MIQRYIYTALVQGFAKITKDISLLEEFFRDQYGLDATEIAAIRTYYTAHPPKVRQGYPAADQVFPCMSIVLAEEGEELNVIGDDGGMVDDEDDPDFGADIKTGFWGHNYSILVYDQHPDAVLYYYELAKSILLLNAGGTGYFSNQGLFNIKISGMDLEPDPRYLPAHLWVRQLSFRCQREFARLDIEAKYQKAWKVSGIALDGDGGLSHVEGVDGKISLYGVGADNG